MGCRQKAETLCKLYSDSFFSIVYTIHPQNIPGEIRGKSSNVAWAARQMANLDQCESAPWDRTYQKDSFASSSSSPSSTSGRSHEIVTVMDADTCFAEDYFTYVTFAYCTAIPEDRKIMMFAPCTIFDR